MEQAILCNAAKVCFRNSQKGNNWQNVSIIISFGVGVFNFAQRFSRPHKINAPEPINDLQYFYNFV